DAKISLERLGEIHDKEDEEPSPLTLEGGMSLITEIEPSDIRLEHVSFRYIGSPDMVLDDISFTIPKNKTTAIVGASGSGKTTLLKLLMKFYEPVSGELRIANYESLGSGKTEDGSEEMGVSGSPSGVSGKTEDGSEEMGVSGSPSGEYIESLPLSYNTKIGNEGIGMSGGQKQRLLIARAVYKNPEYIFFDEATSSLDANNEKEIIENLDGFLKERTAVIVAHRLSTVKHADNIIVLEKGKIIEQGTHQELTDKKGASGEMGDGRWEMGDGRLEMEDWRLEMGDGRWKMEDGRWEMEDGRWEMEDG
ncbi:unnamed protein product, partial [Darwinula stevensoni]